MTLGEHNYAHELEPECWVLGHRERELKDVQYLYQDLIEKVRRASGEALVLAKMSSRVVKGCQQGYFNKERVPKLADFMLSRGFLSVDAIDDIMEGELKVKMEVGDAWDPGLHFKGMENAEALWKETVRKFKLKPFKRFMLSGPSGWYLKWVADVPSEDEHVELKEAKNRYDFEKLVSYCVALANDKGGRLVLGVSDKRPRQVVGTKAFEIPAKTVAGIYDRIGLRIEWEEIAHPFGRVLVFHVPSRPRVDGL